MHLTEPTVFKPHALAQAPIIREGRITRDLTMPARDWSQYDAPACQRRTSRVIRNEVSNERRS
jgi:hypothetical protein